MWEKFRTTLLNIIVTASAILVFAAAFESGCFENHCTHYGDIHSSEQEIKFWYSDLGAINDYETYSYKIVITNYENNKMTAKDFAEIARKYIDTARDDRPISSITFAGQPPHSCILDGKYVDDYNFWGRSYDYKKYLIITIGFENNFPQNKGLKNPSIDYIAVWHTEKPFSPSGQKGVDSILQSNVPLDNGY
ncbi:MAG TPA: hypothetical protein PKM63_10030 [Panacibacter sp.]|nr:hypothetical protein [Panacibacter sp.]HNP44613.1 hypothetical protein [Panacibacter sp.]